MLCFIDFSMKRWLPLIPFRKVPCKYFSYLRSYIMLSILFTKFVVLFFNLNRLHFMILTFNPLGPMQKKEKENLLDLFIYVNLVNLEIYMTTIRMQQMFYSNIQWKLQNSLLLWPIYRPVQKKSLLIFCAFLCRLYWH